MRRGMEKLPEGLENLGCYLVILRARYMADLPWNYMSSCYEVELNGVNDTIGVWSWDWDEGQPDVEILEVISGNEKEKIWERILGQS